MAFEPKTWADGAAGGTPITAAELNRIEQGVKSADDAAGTAPAWGDVTGKPSSFPPADHQHDAGDITGTLAAARIPTLAQSKVTGLSGALEAKADQTALDALTTRIETLETKVEALETPDE